MEYVGYGAVGLGGLIAFIGWIWLLVLGFKQGGALWGILIFLFSGLGGLIFCIVYKTGWIPLAMLILGGIVASIGMVPVAMGQLQQPPVG
jgi:hypothetical protein